jgi:aminoglycoside/choline kinase family phosphotransferase
MNMLMKSFLFQRVKGVKGIKKICREASSREFYRLFFEQGTLVAMVYAQENQDEISKILRNTALFKDNHIAVPEIVEVIDNRIILQEDLGGQCIQKRFPKLDIPGKKSLLKDIAMIIFRLKRIPASGSGTVLDQEKMVREMDFFLAHFAGNFFPKACCQKDLRMELVGMVEHIREINTFAHRDFHSRNMLFHRGQIYLIDYQDALVAPPYYDLVSFAFDSYLDLKSRRNYLFQVTETMIGKINMEQLLLTALQRNIKALGTFGFQVTEKKNFSYRKYIRRTIRHLQLNVMAGIWGPQLLGCLQKVNF